MAEMAAGVDRVVVPQDNVSDDRYLLLAWSVAAGGAIAAGEVLGEFETSKSIFELPAGRDGVFHPLAEEGTQVAVGQVVAVIADRELTEQELAALRPTAGSPVPDADPTAGGDDVTAAADTHADRVDSQPAADLTGVRFSKAAEALIAEHGIDRSHFAGLGLVRGSDVERHLAGAPTPTSATVPDQRPAVMPAQVRGAAIVIIGAGGHAKMILDLLTELRCFQVVGLLDDGVSAGQLVNGHRVLGPASQEQLAGLRGQGLRLAVNAVGGVVNRSLRLPLPT